MKSTTMGKKDRQVKADGKAASGIKVDECLGVRVECRDVAERAALFARLTDDGYRCMMA